MVIRVKRLCLIWKNLYKRLLRSGKPVLQLSRCLSHSLGVSQEFNGCKSHQGTGNPRRSKRRINADAAREEIMATDIGYNN